MRNEGRADLLDAVGERELELGHQKLLDVGAADVLRLLDLDNTENLCDPSVYCPGRSRGAKRVEISRRQTHTWIDRKRARWRAAMSW